MPGTKLTWYFAVDRYTWTESHYLLSTSQPTLPFAWANGGQLLTVARAGLLGVGGQLFKARMTTFGALRQTEDWFPDSYPSFGGNWPPDPTGALYTAARPPLALLVQLTDNTSEQVNCYFAGLPTGYIGTSFGDRRGVQPARAPGVLDALKRFMATLLNGNWGWLSHTVVAGVQVQALVTNANFPGMIGLVVNAQIPGIQPGNQLRLYNWRRINVKSPKLGGVWSVGPNGVLAPTAPATQWTYFLANSGAVSITNFKAMGQVAPYTPSFRTYLAWSQPVSTSRKRGATAGAPRGRIRSRL